MKKLKYMIFFNKTASEKKYKEAKKLIVSLFPKASIAEESKYGLDITYRVGDELIKIENNKYLDEVNIQSTFDLKLTGYDTHMSDL